MEMLYGLSTIQKLKALIRLRSTTPPGEVMPVAEMLAQFGHATGATVAFQEVEPGKPNCLLTYNFGPGPKLVYNTHMDVNNPHGQVWHHDPFDPVVRDGLLYGLGACDAKGSLAAMLGALERMSRHPGELRGTLVLTAVMGEEAGGLGSLYLTQQGLRADAAVVGEPTELNVCTVHKGTYMRRLTFTGRAMHSARSREGINAIDHAAAFIRLYNGLNVALEDAPHPILGPANASVTVIEGGTRQNTIPERCSLIIDRRLLPGETHAKADGELDVLLAALKTEIPTANVSVEVIVATVPSETNVSQPIAQIALEAASNVTGTERFPTAFNGGCDMSKLVTIAHIPTVIFGPGSMGNAHTPDEFVALDQLLAAEEAYEAIARTFLSGQKEGVDQHAPH